MSAIILFLSVVTVVALGIMAAYAAVTGILFVFAQQTRPAASRTPVLVTSQPQASGD